MTTQQYLPASSKNTQKTGLIAGQYYKEDRRFDKGLNLIRAEQQRLNKINNASKGNGLQPDNQPYNNNDIFGNQRGVQTQRNLSRVKQSGHHSASQEEITPSARR